MLREPAKNERPGSNSYFDLRIALEKFVITTTGNQNTFDQLQLTESESSQEWQLFKAALDLSKTTKGLTTVAVTKILHRKRPSLVPLVDRRIRAFFGRRKNEDDQLFHDIQRFVRTHEVKLDEWRKPYSLPNGQPMSRLRVLDIAIWMQSESI